MESTSKWDMPDSNVTPSGPGKAVCVSPQHKPVGSADHYAGQAGCLPLLGAYCQPLLLGFSLFSASRFKTTGLPYLWLLQSWYSIKTSFLKTVDKACWPGAILSLRFFLLYSSPLIVHVIPYFSGQSKHFTITPRYLLPTFTELLCTYACF